MSGEGGSICCIRYLVNDQVSSIANYNGGFIPEATVYLVVGGRGTWLQQNQQVEGLIAAI